MKNSKTKHSKTLALAGISLLAGCSTFGERSGGAVTTTVIPNANAAQAIGTEAETRLVLTRPRAERGVNNSALITCSEPSPDIALIAANAFSGSVGASGALFSNSTSEQARASIAASRAEQAAELGRRLATVQLARDTLFRACEAYANGAIDEAMYSVMLSRFDDLMVALFAVEMAQGGNDDEAQAGFANASAVTAAMTRLNALEAEAEPTTDEARTERTRRRQELYQELSTAVAASGVGRVSGARPGNNGASGAASVESIAEDFFNDANADAIIVACIAALTRKDGELARFRERCARDGGIVDDLFAANAADVAIRRRTEYARAFESAMRSINQIPDPQQRANVLQALTQGMQNPPAQ